MTKIKKPYISLLLSVAFFNFVKKVMADLPNCIQKIILGLEKYTNLNNDILMEIIENAKVCESELLPYNTFNHIPEQSYGKRKLYEEQNFGIYVMSWNPGDFTAIHNHGHSEWGAVYFFGNATHRCYKFEGNSIKLISKEYLKAGTIAPVCGDFIHAMGNTQNKAFITLHIYGSNTYKGCATEDTIVYEIKNKRKITSKGSAYLLMKPKDCKKMEYGLLADQETSEDFSQLTQSFFERHK